MPKKDGTMNKTEARKEVQKLMAQAEDLLNAAGLIMDEHQFTVRFMDVDYIPRQMKFIDPDTGKEVDLEAVKGNDRYSYFEAKGSDLGGFYFEANQYSYLAGTWKSSSDWRGC